MRKKNFAHYIDGVFWFIISAFPVICYLFSYLSHTYTPISLNDYLPFVGVSVNSTFVFGVLSDLFGASGTLPLFGSTEIISVLTWFINVQLIHLAVDFILFIPRIAHCFMNKFTGVAHND